MELEGSLLFAMKKYQSDLETIKTTTSAKVGTSQSRLFPNRTFTNRTDSILSYLGAPLCFYHLPMVKAYKNVFNLIQN